MDHHNHKVEITKEVWWDILNDKLADNQESF